jgi:hypothetical protein
MDEPQPSFKVVDRRPFNPDGSPREVSPEEADTPGASTEPAPVEAVNAPPPPATATESAPPQSTERVETHRSDATPEPEGADPLGAHDPASFLNFAMSIASNAAASMGMMAHPVTGESGVDLESAKHWIDILGMLERKTKGNLHPKEEQVLEGLLGDLRMQYVSLQNSPMPPPARFSASDITGGR